MSHPRTSLDSDDHSARSRADVQLAIGIDNLSVLQELYGDELGRPIVDQVEARLRHNLPMMATLTVTTHLRFLIALEECQQTELSALMDGMQHSIAADPIETAFGPVAISVSIGCAVSSEGSSVKGVASTTVALHALHTAMARGIGSIEIANDDWALLKYRSELMAVSQAANGALASNDVLIAHQPVVRAEGGHTISFHECLVRVRRNDGSLLQAGDFMPAIERLGMAPMIDRRVLQLTFETLRQHPSARLSVNIFPHTMQDREWLRCFEDAVEQEPELAERLIVEVTETAAMLDIARTQSFMNRLRVHGVSFALDDFGAGHTSLRQLRDLRFDILKIDGQFIRGIEHSLDDAFLVETLVTIAQRFEMMTVAEAVQTPAEARCLANLGVEFFQGFCFGSPSLRLNPTNNPMPMVAAQA